jgi:hypothetical protein
MIAWAGFIAKIVEFVSTKLIGKIIDISLDRRSCAAKTFLAFYNSFVSLEKLLEKIIAIFDEAQQKCKPAIFSKKMIEVADEIQEVSKDFLGCLNSTVNAIHIFDPKLAALLAEIRVGKGHWLSIYDIFSDAKFNITAKARRNMENIIYTFPGKDAESIDLEKYYQNMENLPDIYNKGTTPEIADKHFMG